MRILKRRIRNFFALQAILLFLAGLRGLLDTSYLDNGISPLRHWAFLSSYLLLSLVFARAWRTTRKPTEFQDAWGTAASLISISAGVYLFWLDHSSLAFAAPGIAALVIGVSGFIIYGQGGSASEARISTVESEAGPAAAPAKLVPIAGDRTHPWVNHFVTGFYVAAEFAAIFFWAIWANAHGLPQRSRIPWVVLFTLAVLITTVLHECGHALVARCFHMKLLSFNAGPLRWQKRDGQWKFKLDPEGFFNLGGAVRVVPTNSEQPRAHDLCMIAAGPLANIVFGLLFLFAVLYGRLPWYSQTWKLVALSASFSFIAAIANLFPFRTESGGYSDGARLLQILTHSPLDDYHRLNNALAATLVTPRRYRDLDIAAIEQMADRFADELKGIHLHLCACNFYLDSDRVREARLALAEAEAIFTSYAIDVPIPICTSLVIKNAYLNHSPARARFWWDRLEAKKPKQHNFDYWLAQSALFSVEGHPQDAEQAWQKADAEARNLPHFGAYEFDRSLLAMMRHELDHPSQVPVPVAPPAPRFRQPSVPVAPVALPDAPAAEPAWDPLQFIRTPSVLDKLRS
jgi:Zn-dependent protease